jgi:hypothetical protein
MGYKFIFSKNKGKTASWLACQSDPKDCGALGFLSVTVSLPMQSSKVAHYTEPGTQK